MSDTVINNKVYLFVKKSVNVRGSHKIELPKHFESWKRKKNFLKPFRDVLCINANIPEQRVIY